MTEMGGNLPNPVIWIYTLVQAAEEPDCILQIVQNIGPLVRCMCADTICLFFKSNKYWAESILQFVLLVSTILQHKEQEATEALLQYEGLLASIVQWGFWEEEYRPDIVGLLRLHFEGRSVDSGSACRSIVSCGKGNIDNLLRDAYHRDGSVVSSEDAKKRMESIATTPIISKSYDSTCLVSYVSGLIRLTKVSGDTESLAMILILVETCNCVDKEVITDVVDLGANFTNDCKSAEIVLIISRAMILYKTDVQRGHPNDTRTAFAIRAGLIEMVLGFIDRFGEMELPIYDVIFNFIHTVSLHKKSSKAISHRRSSIEKEVQRLKENTSCKKQFDMVKSILDLNGTYCCRCGESLDRMSTKECEDCNWMVYCSKACQKDDWFNGGHKLACNMRCKDATMGQFQGRYWPIETQSTRTESMLEELAINVSKIQLKLFLDNADTILGQARSKGIPLGDCVVWFDTRACPTRVDTRVYSDEILHGSSPSCLQGFEATRSEENITCLYCSSLFNGEVDEDGHEPNITMQKLYPHKWLLDFSTGNSKAQDLMNLLMSGTGETDKERIFLRRWKNYLTGSVDREQNA